MSSHRRRTAAAALAVGLALSLASCGDEGSDDAAGGPAGSGVSPGAATGPTPQPEATAEPEPVARIDSLTGEQTAVTLDPGFLAGLTALQVTPAALGSATLDPATGVLSVPVTGGAVTYFEPDSGVEPPAQGLVRHDGAGLQLTGADGAVVDLTDLELDLGGSTVYGRVSVGGQVEAERADLFLLDDSSRGPLQVDEDEGTAVLQGSTLSLTATSADTLNRAFGTGALAESVLVGVTEITLALP